jgi:hypothetical protein
MGEECKIPPHRVRILYHTTVRPLSSSTIKSGVLLGGRLQQFTGRVIWEILGARLKDHFTKVILSNGNQAISKVDGEHRKLQDILDDKVGAMHLLCQTPHSRETSPARVGG